MIWRWMIAKCVWDEMTKLPYVWGNIFLQHLPRFRSYLWSLVPIPLCGFKAVVSINIVESGCVAFTATALSEWLAPKRLTSSPVIFSSKLRYVCIDTSKRSFGVRWPNRWRFVCITSKLHVQCANSLCGMISGVSAQKCASAQCHWTAL